MLVRSHFLITLIKVTYWAVCWTAKNEDCWKLPIVLAVQKSSNYGRKGANRAESSDRKVQSLIFQHHCALFGSWAVSRPTSLQLLPRMLLNDGTILVLTILIQVNKSIFLGWVKRRTFAGMDDATSWWWISGTLKKMGRWWHKWWQVGISTCIQSSVVSQQAANQSRYGQQLQQDRGARHAPGGAEGWGGR